MSCNCVVKGRDMLRSKRDLIQKLVKNFNNYCWDLVETFLQKQLYRTGFCLWKDVAWHSQISMELRLWYVCDIFILRDIKKTNILKLGPLKCVLELLRALIAYLMYFLSQNFINGPKDVIFETECYAYEALSMLQA